MAARRSTCEREQAICGFTERPRGLAVMKKEQNKKQDIKEEAEILQGERLHRTSSRCSTQTLRD